MQQKDIKIGSTYMALVSERLVPVKIVTENIHGGWDGVNTVTGREVRIRSAARLRKEVQPEGRPHSEAGEDWPVEKL